VNPLFYKVRYVGLPQCIKLGGLYLRDYARYRNRRFTPVSPVDPRRSVRSNGTDSSFSVPIHSARQRPKGTPFPPLRDPGVDVFRLHRRVDRTKKGELPKGQKSVPCVRRTNRLLRIQFTLARAGPLATRIPWWRVEGGGRHLRQQVV
jgi:hypothetical protein